MDENKRLQEELQLLKVATQNGLPKCGCNGADQQTLQHGGCRVSSAHSIAWESVTSYSLKIIKSTRGISRT